MNILKPRESYTLKCEFYDIWIVFQFFKRLQRWCLQSSFFFFDYFFKLRYNFFLIDLQSSLLICLMKWKWKALNHSDSLGPHTLHSPWNSPGQSTRVGSLSLLQGIVPTQVLNPGLPYCRQILYQLSLYASYVYSYAWKIMQCRGWHSKETDG